MRLFIKITYLIVNEMHIILTFISLLLNVIVYQNWINYFLTYQREITLERFAFCASTWSRLALIKLAPSASTFFKIAFYEKSGQQKLYIFGRCNIPTMLILDKTFVMSNNSNQCCGVTSTQLRNAINQTTNE